MEDSTDKDHKLYSSVLLEPYPNGGAKFYIELDSVIGWACSMKLIQQSNEAIAVYDKIINKLAKLKMDMASFHEQNQKNKQLSGEWIKINEDLDNLHRDMRVDTITMNIDLNKE